MQAPSTPDQNEPARVEEVEEQVEVLDEELDILEDEEDEYEEDEYDNNVEYSEGPGVTLYVNGREYYKNFEEEQTMITEDIIRLFTDNIGEENVEHLIEAVKENRLSLQYKQDPYPTIPITLSTAIKIDKPTSVFLTTKGDNGRA